MMNNLLKWKTTWAKAYHVVKNFHLFLLPADRAGSQLCKMGQHISVGLKLWSPAQFLPKSSKTKNATHKSDIEPFSWSLMIYFWTIRVRFQLSHSLALKNGTVYYSTTKIAAFMQVLVKLVTDNFLKIWGKMLFFSRSKITKYWIMLVIFALEICT